MPTVPTDSAEPATKADLAELCAELRKDLGDGLAHLNAELRRAMAEQAAETARLISASAKEPRAWFRVLADKIDAINANHATLAAEHARLRHDFDQHHADRGMHRAPRRSRTR